MDVFGTPQHNVKTYSRHRPLLQSTKVSKNGSQNIFTPPEAIDIGSSQSLSKHLSSSESEEEQFISLRQSYDDNFIFDKKAGIDLSRQRKKLKNSYNDKHQVFVFQDPGLSNKSKIQVAKQGSKLKEPQLQDVSNSLAKKCRSTTNSQVAMKKKASFGGHPCGNFPTKKPVKSPRTGPGRYINVKSPFKNNPEVGKEPLSTDSEQSTASEDGQPNNEWGDCSTLVSNSTVVDTAGSALSTPTGTITGTIYGVTTCTTMGTVRTAGTTRSRTDWPSIELPRRAPIAIGYIPTRELHSPPEAMIGHNLEDMFDDVLSRKRLEENEMENDEDGSSIGSLVLKGRRNSTLSEEIDAKHMEDVLILPNLSVINEKPGSCSEAAYMQHLQEELEKTPTGFKAHSVPRAPLKGKRMKTMNETFTMETSRSMVEENSNHGNQHGTAEQSPISDQQLTQRDAGGWNRPQNRKTSTPVKNTGTNMQDFSVELSTVKFSGSSPDLVVPMSPEVNSQEIHVDSFEATPNDIHVMLPPDFTPENQIQLLAKDASSIHGPPEKATQSIGVGPAKGKLVRKADDSRTSTEEQKTNPALNRTQPTRVPSWIAPHTYPKCIISTFPEADLEMSALLPQAYKPPRLVKVDYVALMRNVPLDIIEAMD